MLEDNNAEGRELTIWFKFCWDMMEPDCEGPWEFCCVLIPALGGPLGGPEVDMIVLSFNVPSSLYHRHRQLPSIPIKFHKVSQDLARFRYMTIRPGPRRNENWWDQVNFVLFEGQGYYYFTRLTRFTENLALMQPIRRAASTPDRQLNAASNLQLYRTSSQLSSKSAHIYFTKQSFQILGSRILGKIKSCLLHLKKNKLPRFDHLRKLSAFNNLMK